MKTFLKKLTFDNMLLYQAYVRYKNIDAITVRNKHVSRIKDIVVCGVQRSGSTLLFNIINEIIKNDNHETDTFFNTEKKYKEILSNELSTLVKKNHTYLPIVAKRVKNGNSIGFFTHRDIRDILVSCKQKGWMKTTEEWISNLRIKYMINNSILYAKTPNMHVISYEKLMNDRLSVIEEISEILGIRLENEVINHIEEKTSLKKTKEKLELIPNGTKLHYDDQLHKNHIADGRINKWKDHFSDSEIQFLNIYCKDYLDFFGYK